MDFVRWWMIFSLVSPSICKTGIRRYETDLLENDYCGLDASIYSGKCKKINKCVNLLVEQKQIEICSFNGNTGEDALVCCSRDDFYKSTLINREGPLNYDACLDKYKHLRNAHAEEFSSFVVNGVDVKAGEFPHMAAIGWMRWNSNEFVVDWNCGGSLITESFVLTAAHCTIFDEKPPNLVRFGDVDLTTFDDDAFTQQFGIANIVSHPSYQSSENDHDIALIKLSGEVNPTKEVVPACIIAGDSPTEFFEASGYGQAGFAQLRTNKLSKVQLKFVPMETCQESYQSVTLSADSQMCAQSYRDDIEVQDTCYGDSGSPLQFMKTDFSADGGTYDVPTIVGITSFGIGCAFGHPSVYVKVSNYIEWMESVIFP